MFEIKLFLKFTGNHNLFVLCSKMLICSGENTIEVLPEDAQTFLHSMIHQKDIWLLRDISQEGRYVPLCVSHDYIQRRTSSSHVVSDEANRDQREEWHAAVPLNVPLFQPQQEEK